MVMDKLKEMGFLVKHSESHLEPMQKLQHLGFNVNTKDMTLSVPKDKVRDLRPEATKILNKGTLSIRALESSGHDSSNSTSKTQDSESSVAKAPGTQDTQFMEGIYFFDNTGKGGSTVVDRVSSSVE
ncbi:hypothetical protein BG000_003015 [Podila horticola]|nr:hypothetical protein BG000_003015 [Podila horticola]